MLEIFEYVQLMLAQGGQKQLVASVGINLSFVPPENTFRDPPWGPQTV